MKTILNTLNTVCRLHYEHQSCHSALKTHLFSTSRHRWDASMRFWGRIHLLTYLLEPLSVATLTCSPKPHAHRSGTRASQGVQPNQAQHSCVTICGDHISIIHQFPRHYHLSVYVVKVAASHWTVLQLSYDSATLTQCTSECDRRNDWTVVECNALSCNASSSKMTANVISVY